MSIDPVSAIAVGGSLLKAGGSIAGGMGQQASAKTRAMQLRVAADAGRLRGEQTDTAYREELSSVLQNIGAIRSAQNVAFDSPTSMALYDRAEELNKRARRVAVSNERMKALGLEGDAATIRSNGDVAMLTGIIGSAGDLASAGQTAFKAFQGAK
jgi:hypothetical protein